MMKNIIVDANLSRDFYEELKKFDIGEVIYVNNIKGSMSDQSIMMLGFQKNAYIITKNVRHFLYYDKLVPLPDKKKTAHLLKEALKYLQ